MRDKDEIRERYEKALDEYKPGSHDIGDWPNVGTDYRTMIETLEWVLDE